jgi:hypothetical protein
MKKVSSMSIFLMGSNGFGNVINFELEKCDFPCLISKYKKEYFVSQLYFLSFPPSLEYRRNTPPLILEGLFRRNDNSGMDSLIGTVEGYDRKIARRKTQLRHVHFSISSQFRGKKINR